MDERQRRIGVNEALYRKVNEQLESLTKGFGRPTEAISITCECGTQDCMDQIELSLVEYEQVRADSHAFAVLPGHIFEDVEDAAAKTGRYWVVRKRAEGPAAIARATDARRAS